MKSFTVRYYLPSLLKFINNTYIASELQEIILPQPIYKLRRGIKRLKQFGKFIKEIYATRELLTQSMPRPPQRKTREIHYLHCLNLYSQ